LSGGNACSSDEYHVRRAPLVAFEPERERTDQVALVKLELVLADRLVADATDLAQESLDGRRHVLRRRADVGGEHPRQDAGRAVDAGAHRVRQAELVAQDARDPVRETRTRAEDVIHHDQRGVIGIAARDAEVAEVHVHLLALGRERADARRARRKLGRPRDERRTGGPPAETAIELALDRARVDVAAHGDDRAARDAVFRVESAQLARADALHALERSVRRASEPMVAVHELAKEHAALRARLFALHEQAIEQPLLLPRDLLRGIRRVLQELGGDLDEKLPLIADDPSAQSARVAGDLAARRLELVRDVLFA
jgi:hypothetical protein